MQLALLGKATITRPLMLAPRACVRAEYVTEHQLCRTAGRRRQKGGSAATARLGGQLASAVIRFKELESCGSESAKHTVLRTRKRSKESQTQSRVASDRSGCLKTKSNPIWGNCDTKVGESPPDKQQKQSLNTGVWPTAVFVRALSSSLACPPTLPLALSVHRSPHSANSPSRAHNASSDRAEQQPHSHTPYFLGRRSDRVFLSEWTVRSAVLSLT